MHLNSRQLGSAIWILALLTHFPTSGTSQDLGAQDSVKLVLSVPPTIGSEVPIVVECSVFVDSNSLIGLQFAWHWDNPKIQMDSAKAFGSFESLELISFFIADNLDSTNVQLTATCQGVGIFNSFPPGSDWRHIASFYMHATDWDAASDVLIDTVQKVEYPYTEYLFVTLTPQLYYPVWGGPIYYCESPGVDTDSDGILDCSDNCPYLANSLQVDSDSDGIGDECDPCTDLDGDGFGEPGYANSGCATDNCPTLQNADQADFDGDSIGDLCDNCDFYYNPNQYDSDEDNLGDVCDPCPNDTINDPDGDNLCGLVDNCPYVSNPEQEDLTNDGIGDACCCIGRRGDTVGDGTDADMVDLDRLIWYIFRSGSVPRCPNEADINADGFSSNILDLVFIVNRIFRNGTQPTFCP
jgi:hypothetical protein